MSALPTMSIFDTISSSEIFCELAEYAQSRSGYVRQAAVNRCVNLASPEFLPIIADRLNDWVPEVRQAASFAFIKLMPLASEHQLLSALPGILHLFETRRVNHEEWIAQVEQKLIHLISLQGFIDALKNDNDAQVPRACFYILKKYELLNFHSLISLVLDKRNDIFLAIQAIQLLDNLSPNAQRELYLKAMNSHFGRVRTIAIENLFMLVGDPVEKDILAVDALLDQQSSVRCAAMTYLEARDFDLNEYYDCALHDSSSSAKQIQICLISLSGSKNIYTLDLIKPFTKADKPSIRKVAFLSWLKMAECDKDVIAWEALNDTSSKVRKFSLHVIKKYGAFIPFSSVYKILMEKKHIDLLLNFSKNKKWDWLECITRLAMQINTGNSIEPLLISHLNAWISQADSIYEIPTPEQFEFLNSEVAKSAVTNLNRKDQRKNDIFLFSLSLMINPN